jgi:hypothetical protein
MGCSGEWSSRTGDRRARVASAVLWSRILASRHDHHMPRRVLVVRTLNASPEDRPDNTS